MSSQRETILSGFVTLLEGIKHPSTENYNTYPAVSRKREHWVDTNTFPILFLDEGEPEQVEDFAFGLCRGTLTIQILGRIKGEWDDLNELIEDVRKRVDSTANTWRDMTDIMTVQVVADPNSQLKEFEMVVKVMSFYNRGSA